MTTELMWEWDGECSTCGVTYELDEGCEPPESKAAALCHACVWNALEAQRELTMTLESNLAQERTKVKELEAQLGQAVTQRPTSAGSTRRSMLQRAAEPKTPRALSVIAAEIKKDWAKVPSNAEPYLRAMKDLNDVEEKFGHDSGEDIVRRFLCNASLWKGPVARRVKRELKELLT